MVDATLYKNDGAKLEQPQYNSNKPTVNVTVHNDTVEFGGPGR